MKKKEKGHGGLDVPWWFVPVFALVYPFAAFGEWIRSKITRTHTNTHTSNGDPHDISGEPDIPGGGRP